MSRLKVFISYSHQDEKTANHIARELIKANADVSIDKSGVSAGESFVSFMAEKIQSCYAFLLLWSDAASMSYYVEKEWEAAFIKDEKKNKRKIIPCRLDDTALPSLLRPILSIDFRNNKTKALQELIVHLGLKEKKPPNIETQEEQLLLPKTLVKSLKKGKSIIFAPFEISKNQEIKRLIERFGNSTKEQYTQNILAFEGRNMDYNIINKNYLIYNALKSKITDRKDQQETPESLIFFGFDKKAKELEIILRTILWDLFKDDPIEIFCVFDELVDLEISTRNSQLTYISCNFLPAETHEGRLEVFLQTLFKNIKNPRKIFVASEFEHWFEERNLIGALKEERINVISAKTLH